MYGRPPKLPKLGKRERAVLAAIRGGARGVAGLVDRTGISQSRCADIVVTLTTAGLVTGPAAGPWTLTDAAKAVDVPINPVLPPSTTALSRRAETPRREPERVARVPSVVAPATYEEAERRVKSPIKIAARTSDTVLF